MGARGVTSQHITIPYRPRPLFLPFHNRTQRWSAMVVHRRGGKTVAHINDAIRTALTCELPRPRVAFISPLRNQVKATSWDYCQHYTRNIPGVSFNQAELTVTFPNDSKLTLYGADNPDSLRGIYLDDACLDEFGDMSPRLLPEIIRPALSDRRGRLSLIGTSRGKNHFHAALQAAERDPEWFYANLKASETGILSQEELASARKMMSRDQYAREYENDFEAAIEGAIYRDQLEAARREGRVCSVPYDPSVPVHVSWDLGIGDAMALWFWQVVGKEFHLIDFYEHSGEALGHYFGIIRDKPYRYGDMLVPHDAAARELGTGKSREEVFRANDFRVVIGARLDAGERIDAARMAFPRMWFDAQTCSPGLSALASYHRQFNARMNEFTAQPVHDWASHAADSFGEGVIGLRDRGKKPEMKPTLRTHVAWGEHASWMGS
jgi:phage terminase large subunit